MLQDIAMGQGFFKRTSKACGMKAEIDKWDCI
jgi:hypothetical protein